MDYYNKLNSSIQNSINDYGLQYHLKYFDEIVKLAYIIIENTPKLLKGIFIKCFIKYFYPNCCKFF